MMFASEVDDPLLSQYVAACVDSTIILSVVVSIYDSDHVVFYFILDCFACSSLTCSKEWSTL